ncbi:hypothetical protein AAVH_37957, partial [Aphelenchoides avenae]
IDWLGSPIEEFGPLWTRAKQKDPNRVLHLLRRVRTICEEYAKIDEELEYAPNHTRRKQLYKLLTCKKNELGEAMKDIAIIA